MADNDVGDTVLLMCFRLKVGTGVNYIRDRRSGVMVSGKIHIIARACSVESCRNTLGLLFLLSPC